MNSIPQLLEIKDNQSIIFVLQNIISTFIGKQFEIVINPSEIEIKTPENTLHGDYFTNVALKCAGKVKKNPKEVAESIVKALNDENIQVNFIEKAEIAGPGFINIFLSKKYYIDTMNSVLELAENYGKWKLSESQVMVEFGQPNTHKAFHVGHLKSVITGLSLVKIIENLGFNVIKANYFGDVGMHVAKSVWGFKQKGKPENFEILNPHEKMMFIDQCYTYGSKEFKENPEAEKEIREINKKIYDSSDDKIKLLYLQTREWSLEHQADVFKRLGVIFDRQYPESEVFQHSIELINNNIGKVFEKDDGAIIFPGDKYNLSRWVFITGEGNPTYSGKDLGLAYKKFEEFPDLDFSIVTTSVEVNEYFKAVIKALELIDNKFTGKYFHIGFGWLLRDNKKSSSRMGDSIKGIDILNEANKFSKEKISESKKYSVEQIERISEAVAVTGLKFLILSHELHRDVNYDPEQFLNPEGFSGPYVMYGYVRARSILRQAENQYIDVIENKNELEELISKSEDITNNEEVLDLNVKDNVDFNESELKLLKLISKFPNLTLEAGKTLSPHLISYYLFDLTQTFNQFYKENKVLVEDTKVKEFRLALTNAVAIVLKNGLNLLGIETIEEM